MLSLAAIGEQITQLQKGLETMNASASASVSSMVGSSASHASVMDADEQSDDDERDENGLVRVDICLKLAYEEADDGQVWCKMCRSVQFACVRVFPWYAQSDARFRNTRAVTDEPPTPMSSRAEEDLVRHLMEVHPAGWKRLRGE